MASDYPSMPWLQAVKTSRILLGVVITLSLVIVAQGVSMSYLFPLKEKIPVFVEFQTGGNNFVVVEAASKNVRANQALLAMFVRLYVTSRERIDKQTETEIRYPRVVAMSSPKVSKNFKDIYGNKSTGLFFQEGFKRDVVITRDSSLANGIHQVEFKTIDTIEGRKGETIGEWVATVSYDFADQLVSYDERLMNPMGLFVTGYTLSKRRK